MDSFIFYLGIFYLLIGSIFLLVPLLYLELGRPKDLIKAFLNLSIGFILIIRNKIIDESLIVIFLLLTLLALTYLIELFSSRWNQLTDKEKNKLTTFLEFKKNLSKILEAINFGLRNFTKDINFLNFIGKNKKVSPKKWVRNGNNDNIENQK
jgi:hypothetical protein